MGRQPISRRGSPTVQSFRLLVHTQLLVLPLYRPTRPPRKRRKLLMPPRHAACAVAFALPQASFSPPHEGFPEFNSCGADPVLAVSSPARGGPPWPGRVRRVSRSRGTSPTRPRPAIQPLLPVLRDAAQASSSSRTPMSASRFPRAPTIGYERNGPTALRGWRTSAAVPDGRCSFMLACLELAAAAKPDLTTLSSEAGRPVAVWSPARTTFVRCAHGSAPAVPQIDEGEARLVQHLEPVRRADAPDVVDHGSAPISPAAAGYVARPRQWNAPSFRPLRYRAHMLAVVRGSEGIRDFNGRRRTSHTHRERKRALHHSRGRDRVNAMVRFHGQAVDLGSSSGGTPMPV
jgi:hypothetical protein